ncbi:Sodium/hydrogen exchanger 3 [Morella rubra]|uniref:Sodium/hydrogen exchanger 3 n=1 Tax=Morella rubra TaxID=262757 RepID=A0A6A1USN3_9ROSI|nr:Sodium/hydrogen exchanger 3 [Morella rubra]
MASGLSYAISRLQMLSTSDHSSVVSINLFVALLCACIVIGHLLEENRWVNESITALLIGVCTGVVILLSSGGKSSHLLVFSEDLFFIYLLPPIIFNAGNLMGSLNLLEVAYAIYSCVLFSERTPMISNLA